MFDDESQSGFTHRFNLLDYSDACLQPTENCGQAALKLQDWTSTAGVLVRTMKHAQLITRKDC